MRHCAGAGEARLGNIFCTRANVASDLGGGRAECTELCIMCRFISTKALFASLFWDTLHVALYHPLGSSKSGAPSPSSATWFWSAGSSLHWKLMMIVLSSSYSARSVSSWKQSIQSSTRSLAWYQLVPSNLVRAMSCSFFGQNWLENIFSNASQSWKGSSSPCPLSCVGVLCLQSGRHNLI